MLGTVNVAEPKDVTVEKPEEPTGQKDGVGSVDNPSGAVQAPKAATQPTTGRKPLGAKEPIPFLWKLVGSSFGVALTLFKATEREEVEAQLERVHREGYYGDLRILDINEKVKQPVGAKSAKVTRKGTRTKAASKTTKAKPATPKAKRPKRAAKASTDRKSRVPAKTSKAKTTAKKAKKKSSSSTSTRKRAAKKK